MGFSLRAFQQGRHAVPPPQALPPRQAGPGLQHRCSRRTSFTAREPGEWTTRRESPAPVSSPGVLFLTDCEVKLTWEGNTIGNWNSQAVLVHPNLQTLQWPFLFISVCGVPNQTECLDMSLSQPVGVQMASHLVGRDQGGCRTAHGGRTVPTTKNGPAPNANSAELEKPRFRSYQLLDLCQSLGLLRLIGVDE